ncbi:hypothetical protein GQE99_11890 [Maritimibacter sp. DP07]|uniref:Uncharacterized protein n=1 Tax=Maritimibacter harenae TaxID=2606218 RepID=A0A845M7I8_9RHOB|nr:hypothetical protein [Maritimibacter harenae]MZR13717.1 hypothetical protein [Maritimibacter harenae]
MTTTTITALLALSVIDDMFIRAEFALPDGMLPVTVEAEFCPVERVSLTGATFRDTGEPALEAILPHASAIKAAICDRLAPSITVDSLTLTDGAFVDAIVEGPDVEGPVRIQGKRCFFEGLMIDSAEYVRDGSSALDIIVELRRPLVQAVCDILDVDTA